jgi:hypothetical protein
MPKLKERRKLVYTKCSTPGMRSYREIAEILGDTSYVAVGNILNRAFYKVAEQVLWEANGSEPTRDAVVNLARNEEFQLTIADMLREKK